MHLGGQVVKKSQSKLLSLGIPKGHAAIKDESCPKPGVQGAQMTATKQHRILLVLVIVHFTLAAAQNSAGQAANPLLGNLT